MISLYESDTSRVRKEPITRMQNIEYSQALTRLEGSIEIQRIYERSQKEKYGARGSLFHTLSPTISPTHFTLNITPMALRCYIKESKSKFSAIYCQFERYGVWINKSTGLRVHSDHWNKKRGLPKPSSAENQRLKIKLE
jgi:hypothetical protein